MTLCNYIYNLEESDTVSEENMRYFDAYKITKGSTEGIILANYKSTTGFLWTIIIRKGANWKRATQRKIIIIVPIAYKKFDIKNRETNKILDSIKINTLLVFMTAFSTSKKAQTKQLYIKQKRWKKVIKVVF